MSKKAVVALAVAAIVLLQPFFAQAAEPEPGAEKVCEQLQRQNQALAKDREKMANEIQRLGEENRRLNELLERLRSQLGNGRPGPSS